MFYETVAWQRMFRGTWESMMQGRISLGPAVELVNKEL